MDFAAFKVSIWAYLMGAGNSDAGAAKAVVGKPCRRRRDKQEIDRTFATTFTWT